jgi:hypothetical protein
MSSITPIEFMKFCISQGFEFVMVDEENKIIGNDNKNKLDQLNKKKGLIQLSLRKSNK